MRISDRTIEIIDNVGSLDTYSYLGLTLADYNIGPIKKDGEDPADWFREVNVRFTSTFDLNEWENKIVLINSIFNGKELKAFYPDYANMFLQGKFEITDVNRNSNPQSITVRQRCEGLKSYFQSINKTIYSTLDGSFEKLSNGLFLVHNKGTAPTRFELDAFFPGDNGFFSFATQDENGFMALGNEEEPDTVNLPNYKTLINTDMDELSGWQHNVPPENWGGNKLANSNFVSDAYGSYLDRKPSGDVVWEEGVKHWNGAFASIGLPYDDLNQNYAENFDARFNTTVSTSPRDSAKHTTQVEMGVLDQNNQIMMSVVLWDSSRNANTLTARGYIHRGNQTRQILDMQYPRYTGSVQFRKQGSNVSIRFHDGLADLDGVRRERAVSPQVIEEPNVVQTNSNSTRNPVSSTTSSGTIWGSFTGYGTSTVRPYVNWTAVSNPSDNSSNVKVELYFERYGYMPSYNLDARFNTTIAGSTYTQSGPFDLRKNTRVKVLTRNYTVKHNSDGRKTITIEAGGNTRVSLGTIRLSGTAVLPNIAQQKPNDPPPPPPPPAQSGGGVQTGGTNRMDVRESSFDDEGRVATRFFIYEARHKNWAQYDNNNFSYLTVRKLYSAGDNDITNIFSGGDNLYWNTETGERYVRGVPQYSGLHPSSDVALELLPGANFIGINKSSWAEEPDIAISFREKFY